MAPSPQLAANQPGVSTGLGKKMNSCWQEVEERDLAIHFSSDGLKQSTDPKKSGDCHLTGPNEQTRNKSTDDDCSVVALLYQLLNHKSSYETIQV